MLIYLTEGKNEQKLIEALKSESIVKPAQVIVFNIFTNRIKSLRQIPKATKDKHVCIIFDIDVLYMQSSNTTALLSCFDENMQNLRNRGYQNIILLQQTQSLEEELTRSCSTCNTSAELFKSFNTSGADKFKSEFNKKNDLFAFLSSLGFDINKMWIKPYDGNLQNHENYFGTAKSIINKDY